MGRIIPLIVLVMLAFSPIAFAQCVGYNDSFDVRVLDAKLRAVPGADVWIKYDRGQSFGEQYFTTPLNKTDAGGKIHYNIFNGGTLSRTIDCKIVINASIGGSSNQTTVEANKHGPVVDVVLADLYPLNFYVRDQLNAPIPNASVTIANKTGKTDSQGAIKYYFKAATYEYFASYLDAQQPGSLKIENDTDFVVVFPHYKISIDVTDDTGKPLPAMLTIFNQTFEMENGHFENEKTFGEAVPYKVDYEGIITDEVIYPSVDPIVEIRYDVHSPTFQKITPGVLNNRPRLDIEVSDPGQYASGIDVSSIRVSYRVEPADVTVPWSSAVVFTSGRNKFSADFPELPQNTIVSFMVEIKDRAGNRADVDGRFTTFAGSPQNDTQNQTDTQPPPPSEQGIPLIYIIGGVIVLVLAALLVFRMKAKA
ncbi:MAG: hypothetical protein AB1324_03560 [Candidatus Micrarchaeota archaeon]